ncbi:hypothetical protein Droror1_Dr00017788 [Drosera rotundifolia]
MDRVISIGEGSRGRGRPPLPRGVSSRGRGRPPLVRGRNPMHGKEPMTSAAADAAVPIPPGVTEAEWEVLLAMRARRGEPPRVDPAGETEVIGSEEAESSKPEEVEVPQPPPVAPIPIPRRARPAPAIMGGMKCSSLIDMVDRATGVEKGLRLQWTMGFKRPREAFHSGQGSKRDWKKKPTQAPSQTQAQTQTRTQGSVSKGPWKTCKKCNRPHSFDFHCDGKPITFFACGEAGHRANKCPKGGNRDTRSHQASQGGSSAPIPNPRAYMQRPTTSTAAGQRPVAVQRFGNQAKGKEVDTSSTAPRPPGRVYAMTQEQADIAPDVVQVPVSSSFEGVELVLEVEWFVFEFYWFCCCGRPSLINWEEVAVMEFGW